MGTLLEWGQVQSQVKAVRETLSLDSQREAFSILAISTIADVDLEDARASITDGGNDRGIDAIFIDSRSERKKIHLFQFKFVDRFDIHTKSFPGNSIDKIQSFISDCLRKERDMESSCNPLLWLKINDIWEALEDGVSDFQINFCSNCSPLLPADRQRMEGAIRDYKVFALKEFDLVAFSQKLVGDRRREATKSIRFVEDQLFERSDGNVRGLIGTVKAQTLVDFLRLSEDRDLVDRTLFEENVRVYLGEKNPVNRKIFASAISDVSSEFWYLNNGVTIVCDDFSYQPRSASPVVELMNPQIVNGGQTSHSLFEASSHAPDRVLGTKLLLRIIETKNNSFTNRIAEATNSQTPIRSRDLRSNDDVQLKIEAALEAEGYKYERKRNQHIGEPQELRIDAHKLGQIILAYYLEQPAKAKTQSDRIFGELYELIFDESQIGVPQILTAYRLYNEIEKRRDVALQELRSQAVGDYEEAWIVEGVFHVLFLVHMICEIDDIDSADFQVAKTRIGDACKVISEFVRKQKKVSAYRIFRSANTRQRLSQLSRQQQLNLPFDD